MTVATVAVRLLAITSAFDAVAPHRTRCAPAIPVRVVLRVVPPGKGVPEEPAP